ncbi:UDP-2,3-diacylglucosamine diphosphatase [Legionella oakridgensis]|uniref:UDP-2,3-diacylglucosamine hydrolase n=2 Tax=Legionella oakridgensis TaxID=29423 RepID=W0BF79_9GAMM|nr:UDP-2,3-diacylglucosamine diphosphatase [Legionella oakridgensis]AHE67099.1 UDP-2,3-diacylglucosamine hydrolase [Legionella oakridgensis ATCC 33761 = DSM 21215]ETO93279.1 UDP-2,3-diacylglucosamine hydrolase [Legionella oakridgensis RV-2-2007]KTD44441.1 UDP-2,3-diacylglucosamine hydrolase [Legionella oakridgensis]STY20190.1 UDP-2,3-diacylglucosamine hydrolase [Legionella longbeachae]
MIAAVFISDLHLHPEEKQITKRFFDFVKWAAKNSRAVYILGDFFHVWPGDDALDAWSISIAEQLAWLASQGVSIYFMHGNRDFLLGQRFAQLANIRLLEEPAVIKLGVERVLLVHGDRYCTKDVRHQWLRRLTRNRIFPKLFLRIPFKIRNKFVNKVRAYSQSGRQLPSWQFEVVSDSMLEHMKQLNVKVVIHGHIHKPGLNIHEYQGKSYSQFVLSDWDDKPVLVCYDNSNGFYFDLIAEEE